MSFHEIQDLKYRVCSLERENYSLKNMISKEEKSKDDRVEVNNRVQIMEISMQIIVEQSYNILKEANENIKILNRKMMSKELVRKRTQPPIVPRKKPLMTTQGSAKDLA